MSGADILDGILSSALDDFDVVEEREMHHDAQSEAPEAAVEEEEDQVDKGQDKKILEALEGLSRDTQAGGSSPFGVGGDDHLLENMSAELHKLGNLDGIMDELFSADVFKEPMLKLRELYDTYLGDFADTLPPEELDRYRKQRAIVEEICVSHEGEDSSSDKTMELLEKLHTLGEPPEPVTKGLDEVEGAERQEQVSEADLKKAEEMIDKCKVQ
uniref:Peroxin-19 n=1 Tax=Rhodosorus marinus TaxID=101924 RepID=A0A7S0G440_9RHOD|mmetsp:Transcript_17308/g.24818  ORF Transcript_17308/g.24818 Transcript_17308/m.24818 type:complete len:214 (+) Transcript_17308:574-1215(+)